MTAQKIAVGFACTVLAALIAAIIGLALARLGVGDWTRGYVAASIIMVLPRVIYDLLPKENRWA